MIEIEAGQAAGWHYLLYQNGLTLSIVRDLIDFNIYFAAFNHVLTRPRMQRPPSLTRLLQLILLC